MTEHKKRRIPRGMPGSTEAAARPVLKSIQKTRAKKAPQKDTGGRRTAPDTHRTLTKTEKAKSLAQARKRAASRPTVKKKAQPKAKKRSYGRKMT